MPVNVLLATQAFQASVHVIGRLNNDPFTAQSLVAEDRCLWITGVLLQDLHELLVMCSRLGDLLRHFLLVAFFFGDQPDQFF
jgi:hypothetical protein